MPPEFFPGVELARGLYDDVLAPTLNATPHAAARIGWGSDVFGFDDERSTDHGWGPRAQIFVPPEDVPAVAARIEAALPEHYRGWPVRFGWDDVAIQHHVEVATLGPWLEQRLGLDPLIGIETADWLMLPQQRLLEVTAGAVFHDRVGELEAARRRLAWYPRDVWLWLLACAWRRLEHEEAFVARAAEVGDTLGSRLIAGRQVRELMRLAFLLERRYAPYSKWLGSAFRQLDAASTLEAPLLAALGGGEDGLVAAFEDVARRHNALGLTRELEPTVRRFHGRPFRVIGAERFADACRERIEDPWLCSLPLVGSVDQATDSTEILTHPQRARRLRNLYRSD
jgi:hypothetical protein